MLFHIKYSMTEKIKFATRLKELREEKGLSLAKLEKIVGISPATLSEWERGGLEQFCDRLIKLAELYNVTVGYLLGLEN